MTITMILSALAGLAVLLFGRQLFWLFVGVVGFIVGFELGTQVLQAQPEWVILVVALLIGFIAAVAAMFLQYAAAAVSGFLVGGYLVLEYWRILEIAEPEWLMWILVIIGGVAGALLILLIFDWALIGLSAFTGATMLLQLTTWPADTETLLLIGLTVIGIMFQAYSFMRDGRPVVTRRYVVRRREV